MRVISKQIWGWALYDWANSAYATVVMAGFFPIFFKQYWATELPASESTFYLGIANFSASLVIVLMAPLLGAMADYGSTRKRYLIRFTILGVLMTALLPWVASGEWLAAVLIYILASIGFSGGVTMNDSLLPQISRTKQYDRDSALGYSLGYLGGGLLFLLCVVMTIKPELFYLADTTAAVKLSFLLVSIWWAIFTLPLILWVKEEEVRLANKISLWQKFSGGARQVVNTTGHLRQRHQVAIFLLAYWCYIDGVDTIVRMAVDYGLALGFSSNSLIIALLITQFIGFPAALIFGRIGERWGAIRGIQLAIWIYLGIVIWAFFMQQEIEFYLMAVTIGLVQGGIQSLSRSLFSCLIPASRSGEFFGFYNMLGKFAVLFGPLLVGGVALITQDNRLSILALIPLFVIGSWLLSRVDINKK